MLQPVNDDHALELGAATALSIRSDRHGPASDIFTREQDELLRQVQHITGARSVHCELMCHDTAEGIPEL